MSSSVPFSVSDNRDCVGGDEDLAAVGGFEPDPLPAVVGVLADPKNLAFDTGLDGVLAAHFADGLGLLAAGGLLGLARSVGGPVLGLACLQVGLVLGQDFGGSVDRGAVGIGPAPGAAIHDALGLALLVVPDDCIEVAVVVKICFPGLQDDALVGRGHEDVGLGNARPVIVADRSRGPCLTHHADCHLS